jgi:hypothetical protein
MSTTVRVEDDSMAGQGTAVEEVEEIAVDARPRGRARRIAAIAGASIALGAAATTTALVLTKRDALLPRLRAAMRRPALRHRGVARFMPTGARRLRVFARPVSASRRRLARLTPAARRVARRASRRHAAR